MPCYEPTKKDILRAIGKNTKHELRVAKNKIRKLEAYLCSISGAIERAGYFELALNDINEEESGITNAELKEWWEHHKLLDLRHKRKMKWQ